MLCLLFVRCPVDGRAMKRAQLQQLTLMLTVLKDRSETTLQPWASAAMTCETMLPYRLAGTDGLYVFYVSVSLTWRVRRFPSDANSSISTADGSQQDEHYRRYRRCFLRRVL